MNWLSKIKGIFKETVADSEAQRLARQIDDNQPPYTACKNCGTELHGMYCHKCGQHASEHTSLFKDFISEYLSNTYPIDSQIGPTLWHLIRRPGYVTNEFIAGKRNSYVHPLKLNMFFLFVVLTAMLLFSGNENNLAKVKDVINSELIVVELEFTELVEDSEYGKKMAESPRDTACILFPRSTADKYSNLITTLEAIVNPDDYISDTLIAIIPTVLIDDGVFFLNEDSIYEFNTDLQNLNTKADLDYMNRTWDKMMELISKYLPLLILLTCPVLAWVVRFFNYRKPHPYMHCFVFALHYTAFLEIFFFMLWFLSLIFDVSNGKVFMWPTAILTSLYLTVGLKRVFNDRSYAVTSVKAIMINAFYSMILFFMIVIIVMISIISTI